MLPGAALDVSLPYKDFHSNKERKIHAYKKFKVLRLARIGLIYDKMEEMKRRYIGYGAIEVRNIG